MQHKQVIRMLNDHTTSEILKVYQLEHADYLTDSQSIMPIIDNKLIERNTFRPYIWTIKVFDQFVIISQKIISWFNQLGSKRIDVKTIKVGHNYHLGSRIKMIGN